MTFPAGFQGIPDFVPMIALQQNAGFAVSACVTNQADFDAEDAAMFSAGIQFFARAAVGRALLKELRIVKLNRTMHGDTKISRRRRGFDAAAECPHESRKYRLTERRQKLATAVRRPLSKPTLLDPVRLKSADFSRRLLLFL